MTPTQRLVIRLDKYDLGTSLIASSNSVQEKSGKHNRRILLLTSQ